MPGAADEAADRLYGVPLEDFVSERDAAAKQLRREDREAAAAIAALRKPTAHAWAVNQAVRRSPDLRDELLAAGEALREAQEAAIAGGGRAELREATARERAAVDALLEAAREERPSGRALSTTALDRLRATLHAAAGDDEVRAALAAGRLTADAEAGGAWPFAAGEEVAAGETRGRAASKAAERGGARAATRGRRSAPSKPTGRDGARASKTARLEEKRAEEERRRAEERAAAERRRELQEALDGARRERRSREREFERAEREARRASERLERALQEAEEARERADAARAALEGARTALDAARDDVGRLEEQLD